MGILGGGGGSGNFERLLESATSHLQLEPNWAIILEVCDSIRQKDVTAKLAVSLIRKRIKDVNPHISKLALVTLEACMKNCGEPVHDEVATRDCMDELRVLATSGSGPVKEQILSMVQTWNQTLGKKASYRVIQDTYNVLKAEGHAFPQLNESDAMYLAETAPEWAEGDTCHQCRVKFSTFTRQHHCRCCGQVFCAKCSSKSSIIPKYGIEREVRVCDPCYDSINPAGGEKPSVASKDTQSVESDGLPAEYLNSSLAKEAQTKPKPSEAEIKAQEEEELQLAMALSLSAADADQQHQPKRNWSSPAETPYSSPPSAPSSLYPEPKSNLYTDVVSDSKKISDSSDAELSHYLNRDYWEKRKDGRSTEPSAPVVHEVEDVLPRGSTYQSVEEEDHEDVGENSSAFVKTFSNSIEMFMNRIQTVKSKGKHIAMDSTVQNLFQSLSAMHPQLMKLIEDEEDNKAKYQAMLQKIALVREARESLDNMRNQHREKLSQQELEQEMLRRMQMEQKLELMRQQKQEYLEYQRQLQIQRQQEIEQQQHLKLQQKQFLERQYGYRGNGEYEAVADGYRGGNGYQSMPVNPDQAMSPAHIMHYQQQQQQQQPQQQAGNQFIQQQNQGYQRPEQMAQDPSIPGQQVPQRHPLPQTQPASKAPPAGYMPQGQPMSPQPQAASYSQAQPKVPGSPYQKPQQPTQYPTSVPDLLDAPIGNDLGQQQQQPPQQQQRESQPQGYHNQQFHQHLPQQYQPNQRLSPQQQRFQPQAQQPGGIHQQQGGVPQQVVGVQQPPTGVQQQPGSMQQQPINLPSSISQPPGSSQQQQGGVRQQQPGMHQQPVLQQQSGSMSMPGGGPQQIGGIQQQEAGIQQPPTGGMQQQPSMQPAIGGMLQQAGGQQQPSGIMQQPGMQQQQQHSGLPQQQQTGNMQQQSYPQSVPHTAQAAPTPSYPGQQQQQLYQESNSYPSQYPTQQLPQSQQGPASLPYRQTQSNQGMHGPASLPASLNQYPKGHDTDAGYSPGPQPNAYGQQPQQQAPEPQFSESMKDLQLISFE